MMGSSTAGRFQIEKESTAKVERAKFELTTGNHIICSVQPVAVYLLRGTYGLSFSSHRLVLMIDIYFSCKFFII